MDNKRNKENGMRGFENTSITLATSARSMLGARWRSKSLIQQRVRKLHFVSERSEGGGCFELCGKIVDE